MIGVLSNTEMGASATHFQRLFGFPYSICPNATGETSPHSEAMQPMNPKIMNTIKSGQKDLTFRGDYPVFTKCYPLINH